jgi:RNA polymerase sigma-70 factor (ECF subfamily)
VALPDEVEARLVERLVARDERAFNELVRMYEGRVVGLVTRLLNNRAEAEEVSQEVFVQIFKNIGTFRRDSKLSTWILKIAVNLTMNRSKYLAVRKTRQQDELGGVVERAAFGDSAKSNASRIERPDEALAGKQIEAIVREAMLELEPSFRECLILRDVEDLSYEEIEAITGLPTGTLKSKLFRARTKLREIVEARMGEKLK